MSDSAITQNKSWPRFIRTMSMFALAGPVIGGGVPYLALFAVLALPVMIELHGIGQIFAVLWAASSVLAIGLVYAVVLAILPAVISGFVIAAREYSRGRSSVWFAAVVGLQAGLVAAAAYWWVLGWSSDQAIWIGVVGVVAGSILASVICWWLVRPRLSLIERDI